MLSTILQKEHATFTNYGLIRMGDALVDAIDDFGEKNTPPCKNRLIRIGDASFDAIGDLANRTRY